MRGAGLMQRDVGAMGNERESIKEGRSNETESSEYRASNGWFWYDAFGSLPTCTVQVLED